MSLAIRMLAEPLRSLGFAAISPVYMGVGNGFSNPSRILYVQNLTDKLLYFSFDGVDDHFTLPALGYILLDVTTNQTTSQAFFISQGQRIYVRSLAGPGIPTAGIVSVSTFYGANA